VQLQIKTLQGTLPVFCYPMDELLNLGGQLWQSRAQRHDYRQEQRVERNWKILWPLIMNFQWN